MKLLAGHKEIDPLKLYSFKCYLSEFWIDYKNLKIALNTNSRFQNILGVEDRNAEPEIFVPPFHLLKPIVISDDLRHIIDTPVKALQLISKIETRAEIKNKKDRLDNL